MLEIKHKYRKKTGKTEIVIFLKDRYRGNFNFKLDGKNISIVDSFENLGVFFNYNGLFVRHKTHLVGQSSYVCIIEEIKRARSTH